LEAWREQAGASLSIHMLPGDHFFLRTSETELLSILAEELRQTVDSLRASV
jgi:medium-chain acyl-[acyl-carrier-protein] hydrolase